MVECFRIMAQNKSTATTKRRWYRLFDKKIAPKASIPIYYSCLSTYPSKRKSSRRKADSKK